jgi:hypothetical protein
MSYRSTTIAELLPRINRDLFIPGIQRPFVWQPEQILRLFDSLMQRYPISSFLFWDLAMENRADWEIYSFVSDFWYGDIHNKHAELAGDEPVTLVLDGQQRLTSLLIGLKGSYTIKQKHKRKRTTDAWNAYVLYLDLAYTPTSDDDEVDPIEMRYRFEFFEEATRPSNSNGNALWFQVGHILAASDEDQRDKLIQRWVDDNARLDADRKQVARDTLARLWETFWRDDAIAYYTETSQSYDKVLDIFIRANDGGTKLSRSDLLMSVITLRWQQFNARDETEALLGELTKIAEPPRALEREFVLRACLYFADLDFGFKLTNFSPANIARIENLWPSVKAALLVTAQTLRANGIYGEVLASHNVLMLIGYYVLRMNRERQPEDFTVDAEDAERIRRWVIALVFHGLLGLQTSRTFTTIRNVLRDTLRHGTDFPSAALSAALRGIGRPMDFDTTALSRFCAHGATERLGPALLSLVYGADLATVQRRPEPLVQPRFLGTEYLRTAGMAEPLIALTQELIGRLQLAVALTEAEREEYYARDFEDWIATRPEAFFAIHALPPDRSLYRLDRLLDLAGERKILLGRILSSSGSAPETATPLSLARAENDDESGDETAKAPLRI